MRFYLALFTLVLLAMLGLSRQAATLSSEESARIAASCKANERFTGQCESQCQTHCVKPHWSCGSMITRDPSCGGIPCEFMCICNEGFVRDERRNGTNPKGECVREKDCLPPLKWVPPKDWEE